MPLAHLQVSTPDKHGFCTLGPSVDITRSAVKNAKCIIGQINPRIPRTFGDSIIHISHLDYVCYVDDDLPERVVSNVDDKEKAIGKLIADSLVEDGATLQIGLYNNFSISGFLLINAKWFHPRHRKYP